MTVEDTESWYPDDEISAVEFTVDQVTGIATAQASGVVTAGVLGELSDLLRQAATSGTQHLVLDLTRCTTVPAHTAGVLNLLAAHAAQDGADLSVRGLSQFDDLLMRADGLAKSVETDASRS